MPQKKKEHPKEKSGLHPRNRHRNRYDFKELIKSCPELAQYVKLNKYNDESIDFFNPDAVKILNTALLKYYYDIDFWDIPKGYLCPPIPGRADYIHNIADLLSGVNNGKIHTGNKIKCLDIGAGANFIYPIIGNKEYGWSFVGSEIDVVSIKSVEKIITRNPHLKGKIEIRQQNNSKDIFRGIIKNDESFDITVCNPPFHSSFEEAQASSIRKIQSLKHKKIKSPILNFGGKTNELWCDGGEERFMKDMIHQSKEFSASVFWFSSLISKQSSLKRGYKELEKVEATEIKNISNWPWQ